MSLLAINRLKNLLEQKNNAVVEKAAKASQLMKGVVALIGKDDKEGAKKLVTSVRDLLDEVEKAL